MKIISKYKDYYDYLSGVYGVDEKLVLDRRKFNNPYFGASESRKFTFIIAGYLIDGYYHKGDFYYGDDVKQFEYNRDGKDKRRFHPSTHNKPLNVESIYISDDNWRGCWVALTPYKDPLNKNEEHDCAILFESNFYGDYKYPILKEHNLQSFIPADEMWKMLSEWLSNQITKKEQIIDNRSDNLKLESKGFDKKKSFRPKMK